MKRVISGFLLLVLFLSAVSCRNSGGKADTGNGTTTGAEDEPAVAELLGFAREDNGGQTFNVLLSNNQDSVMGSDFEASAESADKVEAATFNRNRACEEYLGITLKYTPENGGWNGTMHQTVDRLVFTGDQTYGMVVMGMNAGIMNGTVGSFANVLDMDYIDLSHSWWVPDLDENVAVNGKLILLAGDSCISTYGYLGCIFANLTVAQNYNVETDFYQTVRDREWTLETFLTIASQVSEDRDGDGEMDVIGWANCQTGVRIMWSSCDLNLIRRDSNGEYYWPETLDQRSIQMAQRLADANKGEWNAYFSSAIDCAQDLSIPNRALFLSFCLFLSRNFTGIEDPYAILPMPLYDSSQENYLSVGISAYNALFFLTNTKNPDLSGKVAEFMGWYGSEHIIPEYYDNSLKYRYSNLENNIEMLELIRDTISASANETFGVIDDGVGILAMTAANTNETGFYSNPVSVYRNRSAVLNIALREYMSKYDH